MDETQARHALALLDRATAAIERIESVDEAKDLQDKAAALRFYGRAQNWAAPELARIGILHLRFSVRLGELLAETPKAKGARGQLRGRDSSGGARSEPPEDDTPTLAELGITKKQSSAAQKLAAVPREIREEALRVAEEKAKPPSAASLLRAAKEAEREQQRAEDAAKIAAAPPQDAPPAPFATILVDPPWDWGDEGDVNQLGRAKPDYATIDIAGLRALRPWGRPVREWAEKDAHLYLWITNRSLPKGFTLLEAWGFRYVTMLTWPKPSFGMGNYFRGQTEHVLFGVRGSQALSRKDVSTLLPTWKRGPGGHSSKPVEFHGLIESCSPGPYLELFGRRPVPGWTIWGSGA